MSKTIDRPPIVSFLLLFAGLLAIALGLAWLSASAEPPQRGEPVFGEPHAEAGADAKPQ